MTDIEAYASQAKAWLAETPIPENTGTEVSREFMAKLYDAGYSGISWPAEYGGQGLSNVEERVFQQAARGKALPTGVFGIGFGMCGPTLLSLGTEEQKKRYIRPLLRGEEIWCQLFSEPGAGSDLASLSTTAVRDGDEWVVNGQKVWTSLAHQSAYGVLIARTNPDAPKQQGISYFICPMDAPGIEIRPIIEMTGGHTFNEVFLTDVRLPAENLVGQVDDGWRLAKVTLSNERVSLSSGGALWGMGPTAETLLDVVRDAGGAPDPITRDRLAELYIESEILRLIRLRTITAAIKGTQPGPEASVRKILADEHGQRIMELAVDMAGPGGMLTDVGPLGSPVGLWHFGFLFSPALTVGGGTGDVQRNIVAEKVLGLPHDVDVEQGRTWAESRRAGRGTAR